MVYNNNSDIEWKVIYIGSAEDESYDQVLDSVFIGPLQVGSMKFTLDVFNINLRQTHQILIKYPKKTY